MRTKEVDLDAIRKLRGKAARRQDEIAESRQSDFHAGLVDGISAVQWAINGDSSALAALAAKVKT